MPVRRLVVRHCARKRGMALHHKLCHTLGVTFNLPHAETHTIVLPDAIAYNEDHAKAQTARISGAPLVRLKSELRAAGAELPLDILYMVPEEAEDTAFVARKGCISLSLLARSLCEIQKRI